MKKFLRTFLIILNIFQERKLNNLILETRSFGWAPHYETSIFEDNTDLTTQYFRNLFYGHNILRPACYECNYANVHRPADITIADFWGIENIAPEFLDEIGVSLTILNNEKGKKWFNSVMGNLDVIECRIEDCIKATYTLNQPTPRPETREEFWNDYNKGDFKYIIEKYAK